MAVKKKPAGKGASKPGTLTARVRRAGLVRAKRSQTPAVFRLRQKDYILETRPDAVKKPFPYALIFSILAVMAVAMYVLSLRVTLDSLTADISRMEREIEQGVEEENALEVRLNAKYDLTEIERIAREEYGMVNKDTLPKKYVSVSGEDEIEVLPQKGAEETE